MRRSDQPASFVVERRAYDHPDVVAMIAEVQEEYVRLYGSPDAAQVAVDEFAPPGGLFLVGLLDGEPVATGGWRRRADDEAELKRMYVSQRHRGRGLSRTMLGEIERTAAAAGITRLVLSTGPVQVEAIGLYESSGYVPGPRFGHYADEPRALFYAKQLSAAEPA